MDLEKLLNWRYASKRMNGAVVPQEKIDRILEAVRLTATSYGIQPFTVIVISDPETLAKLKPAANNQPQITECSHLLVFAAWRSIREQDAEAYIKNIMDTRNMPLEGPLLRMQDGLKKFGERPLADQFAFACNQAHIALGTALVAAAAEEVDSTPMGGFNPAAVDEILGLPELNLGASVLLTLGYRSPDDFLAKAKKVRRASSDFFIFNPPVKG